MNDPIISPWLIYIIYTVDSFHGVIFFFTIASGLLSAMSIAGCIIQKNSEGHCWIDKKEENLDRYDKEQRGYYYVWQKIRKVAIVIFIPTLLITTFLPSSNIILKIYIASIVTPATISKAIETGKDIKDEIVNDIILILRDSDKLINKAKEITKE